MTIRVSVKNEEAEGGRAISIQVQEVSKASGMRTVSDRIQLAPGQSHEFYIHQLRDLLVEEEAPGMYSIPAPVG